jgi:large subunit ribosomal protein L9
MEIILKEDVYGLGRRGDIVNVTDGYGRNYLIPKDLAVRATPGNIREIEQKKIVLAKQEAKYVEESEILAQELALRHVLISRKSGDAGVLFGSVTAKDITGILASNGINLDRRKLVLRTPIKGLGNYEIEVRLHSDVNAKFMVSVLPETDAPVAKVVPRGEESDLIIKELEAKLLGEN